MSGSVRDGELDPTPRSPQVPRWGECDCERVAHGECLCSDDGMVTHGGNHAEAFDHGHAKSGQFVRCGSQR